jgi:hypothetical protein
MSLRLMQLASGVASGKAEARRMVIEKMSVCGSTGRGSDELDVMSVGLRPKWSAPERASIEAYEGYSVDRAEPQCT